MTINQHSTINQIVSQQRVRFATHCLRDNSQVISEVICWRLRAQIGEGDPQLRGCHSQGYQTGNQRSSHYHEEQRSLAQSCEFHLGAAADDGVTDTETSNVFYAVDEQELNTLREQLEWIDRKSVV